MVGEYSCAFGVGADRDTESFLSLAIELSGKVIDHILKTGVIVHLVCCV